MKDESLEKLLKRMIDLEIVTHCSYDKKLRGKEKLIIEIDGHKDIPYFTGDLLPLLENQQMSCDYELMVVYKN